MKIGDSVELSITGKITGMNEELGAFDKNSKPTHRILYRIEVCDVETGNFIGYIHLPASMIVQPEEKQLELFPREA